ncbi:MAG TPA: TolC family protein [Lutibacter sp.]|nr:TolC family protein [Lutibacter sp.]
MKMKKLTYILLLLATNVFSQTILTKEQALQNLLENNYAIKLSKNDIKIAENNTSIYNSRYLPSVSLGAGANYSLMNQEVEAQNGVIANYDNSETQNYNASVGVNYILFNGFNRKYASKQLQEQLAMSQIESEAIVEQAILDVFSNYYQTAQIAENVNVLHEALQISKQRLKRTKYQYDYGQTTKLALLNAQVDINNDSINYINTKQLLDNSKRTLLVLIGDTRTQNFEIETGVQFVPIPSLEVLLADLPENTTIKQLDKAIEIGEYGIKISKSSYLPSLGVNTSYAWNTGLFPDTSEAARNMNYGLNAGLSLNWTIFDGGATKTRVQNAQINQENQVLRKEQIEQQVRNFITNTYYNYQNKRLVLETQKQNLQTAQRNFERTTEMFKLGSVSSVEYRQAQLNLLNAQTAILRAKYEAKVVELQLLQLTGRLVNGV